MSSYEFLTQSTRLIHRVILVLLLKLTSHDVNHDLVLPQATRVFSDPSLPDIASSLMMLNLNGHFYFNDTHHVAKDFGNRYYSLPMAVLSPKTVSDISVTIKQVYEMGPTTELTVTARGHGHSLQGQSLSQGGIVISMESLKEPKMHVHVGEVAFVDVSGGELWIDILHETLKYGLSPKSWTDYLYLTVGGTLSNAGISGQTFRHGPQISNVYQLEVVTGKGDIVKCSKERNADLFYSVLGGLGQFGIITRARISLQPAPAMVKWIRVLYSDFYSFSKDQEQLISSEISFDYIEGFVIINRTGLVNSWRFSFSPKHPLQASQFRSEGKTLYCLELAMYFDPEEANHMNQRSEYILSKLNYIPHTLFQSEVSYVDFLNRVHLSEMKLREKGLWDVPHPWLNLIVPKSKIHYFAEKVFGYIVTDTSNGPVLLYPINQSRWNNKTSMVTPPEDVFYLVAFLTSATPSSTGSDGEEYILTKNKEILDFCKAAKLGVKQYLPHYHTQDEWRVHFGPQWSKYVKRKLTYDPLAILAPGQRIFSKANVIS